MDKHRGGRFVFVVDMPAVALEAAEGQFGNLARRSERRRIANARSAL
jgi:hypothetical protein